MASIDHPNFEIDQMIDNYVKHNFDQMYHDYLEKISDEECSEEQKEDVALQMLYSNKESLKVALKLKQAREKKCKKLWRTPKKVKKVKNDNIRKKVLVKNFNKMKRRIVWTVSQKK